MRFSGYLSAGLLGAFLATGAAVASPRLDVNGPANVPPSSFKGRQFVDNAGCVFVRAGFGDTVRWVPRVSRDRKHICGYKPSFGAEEKVIEVAKTAPVAPVAPVVTAAPAVAAAPVAQPVAPAPTVFATPAAVPALPAAPVAAPRFGLGAPLAAPVAAVAATTTPRSYGTVFPGPSSQVVAAQAGVSGGAAGRLGGDAGAPMVITPPGFGYAPAPRVTRMPAPAVLAPMGAGAPTSFGAPLAAPVLTAAPSGYVSPYALAGYAVSTPGVAPRLGGASPLRPAPVAPMLAPPLAGPVAVGAGCANLSPVAQQYMRSSNGLPVRCGPQGGGTFVTGQAAGAAASVVVSSKAPAGGYVPAFEDGRLNPYRGPQTVTGDLQMGQIWSNESPMRAVSAQTPARKRIDMAYLEKRAGAQRAQPAPGVRLSSKSAPAAGTPKAAGARYVQVGSFGQPANAEAAKARIAALGLPVAVSRVTRGGKLLQVVLAGPMGDPGAALSRLRAAGFGDAVLR